MAVNVRKIVIIGLMSAVCFVATHISIPISLPFGKTMIHFGNIFMILSALLFGRYVGAFSPAIGMSLFDLSSGTFIIYAPGTFIIKFISGYVCGAVAYPKNKKQDISYMLAAFTGIFINVILSPLNTIFINFLTNNYNLLPVIISAFGDFFVSILNGIISVAIAIPIFKVIRLYLSKYNILK